MPARWLKIFIYILFSVALFTTAVLAAYYYSGRRIPGENGNFNLLSGPCKNSNLTTGLTKGNFEVHIEGIDLINVNVCFQGFDNIKDSVFPNNSLRLKIGFYDNKGKLHTYPARIGGVDNKGGVIKTGLCLPKDSEVVECRVVDLSEILAIMKENTVWEAQILYDGNLPWPAASQLKKNYETTMKLKEAIKNGTGFPEAPKNSNFVVQIWSLYKLE